MARIAWILTIFGLNESQRRHLFWEKISNERNERKVFEKFLVVVPAVVIVVGRFWGDTNRILSLTLIENKSIRVHPEWGLTLK